MRTPHDDRTDVPAVEHFFTELPPQQLYVDNDFLVSCLVRSEPHHARCVDFMARAVEHGGVELHLSSLLWMEFIHTVTKEQFRQRLPENVRKTFALHRWQEPPVRRAFIAHYVGELELLLSQFDWAEVALTSEIRSAAMVLIADHSLGMHDAVHLATAIDQGVVDLASLDRGFRRVDGLHLWNDRIYDAQQTTIERR